MVDDMLDELTAATAALRRAEAKVTAQRQYRDDLILRARTAGTTWVALQHASGMTPRGVKQALTRTGAPTA